MNIAQDGDQGQIVPRDSQDLSPEQQAIIGSVVGGAVVIASKVACFSLKMTCRKHADQMITVTAGLVFFLLQKQKWDRIRRREEALLALNAPFPPAYDSTNSSTNNININSNGNDCLRSSPPREPSLLPLPTLSSLPTLSYQCHSRDVEDQPPAYDYGLQSMIPIPVYDPSRYYYQQQQQQQQFRPASVLTVNGGYLHYLSGDAVQGYGQRASSQHLSVPFGGNRHTMQGLGGGPLFTGPVPGPGPGPGYSQEMGGSNTLSAPNPVPAAGPVSNQVNGEGPRKPKPVLSKLITNFG